MINLDKTKLRKSFILALLMLVFGSSIFIISYIQSGNFLGGYLETITAGSMLGVGVSVLLSSTKLKKRYLSFFQEDRVITIPELAKEIGISEKRVIAELTILVKNKNDAKKIATCESVKFGA